MEGKIQFAEVDGTINDGLVKSFKIRGYPTIMIFLPNKSLYEPLEYQGARSADAIEFMAYHYLSQYSSERYAFQLTSGAIFDNRFIPKNDFNFIAFLPRLIDTKASGKNFICHSIRYNAIKTTKSLLDIYNDLFY